MLLFVINSPSVSKEFSLSDSYLFYKSYYMSKDGRIMDPQKQHISTSEGQSYMLLKSLLMCDKETFDLVYAWSKNNLQRQDALFSWLWGENKSGDYKILDPNSASDADIDISFALILAYEKWGEQKYLDEARLIINSIWNNETREIYGRRVLTPGVVQNCCEKVELNPSYFSPYAFKLFQKYDPIHNWNALTDSSYDLIEEASKASAIGLPPDWFVLENNKVVLENNRSNFSYDAIRVFPRALLDYKMTGDKRALQILKKSDFFVNQWESTGNIYTNYTKNGEIQKDGKFFGSVAILVSAINVSNEKVAKEIYNKEIYPQFKNKTYWCEKKEYYAQNLLWFGYFFYRGWDELTKEFYESK